MRIGKVFSAPSDNSACSKSSVIGSSISSSIEEIEQALENKSISLHSKIISIFETLDKNGFQSTKIVAKDGYRDICDEVKLDKGYEEAVDIIGLHWK